MQKISQCEYCGDDLGETVTRHAGDPPVVCGKRECNSWGGEMMEREREDRHAELDRELGCDGRY
jgi:hypothetical protein